MSKDIRESLSALMDGEASELEVRRLLREDSE
ncbi:MAG: negative regulator of sigma E activity, partial [Bermanella sp.]